MVYDRVKRFGFVFVICHLLRKSPFFRRIITGDKNELFVSISYANDQEVEENGHLENPNSRIVKLNVPWHFKGIYLFFSFNQIICTIASIGQI